MHTQRVRDVLAQADALRVKAAEVSKGLADRRWGINGYVNADSDPSALLKKAQALEESVVIRVRTLPVFAFSIIECGRSKVAADRRRTLDDPNTPPRLRNALLSVIELERAPYRSAIRPHGL